MKKNILVVVFVVAFFQTSLAVDWKDQPPPPAKVIVTTPGYNWFDPTLRRYYWDRIPGTKYYTSGCTEKDYKEYIEYNKRVKEEFKRKLQQK